MKTLGAILIVEMGTTENGLICLAMKESGPVNIFVKGVLNANPRNFRTTFGHLFLFYLMQNNIAYY